MKRLFILIALSSVLVRAGHLQQLTQITSQKLDTTKILPFYNAHPGLEDYSSELKMFYTKYNYTLFWQDEGGLTDFAKVLYNELQQLPLEGIFSKTPYAEEMHVIYMQTSQTPNTETDLLITSLYLYYIKKVQSGIEPEKSMMTGWYLPREKIDYTAYIYTHLKNPSLPDSNEDLMFKQYYNLKKGLGRYLAIKKSGGWGTITLEKGIKQLKPADSSIIVTQVRERLFKEGYLRTNSGKAIFDTDLITAVNTYKGMQNKPKDSLITRSFIDELNISIDIRIRCIAVNMERCRWIPPSMNNEQEFIAVNIPSYRLHYFREGKPFLVSKVVVGKDATKTTVFSGEISYVVFSPYWNIPNSILQKEIKPAIKKNSRYLASHNMEWRGNILRQKPGPDNPLGLVKFIFPNTNNIYLHDTPSQSLFSKQDRAFSHGCIRVEKAQEIAIAIMAKDGNWTGEKTNKAMHAGKESVYNLKHKIPVYIGYFTAWADEEGTVTFYQDIYDRDLKLANLLYN